jgi:aminopeptidase YwaD
VRPRLAALAVAAAALAVAAAALAAAALGGTAAAADSPVRVPADAHRVAAKISSWGPRPAASEREQRALALIGRVFRRADLRVGTQRFRVPRRGRSGNVIGVFDTPRSCLRIVMAHADSGPGGPGANDNASGLGVVAALAGRLRLIRPWCDVWLVATGAEERGYTKTADHLGALALARRARAHGARKRLRWALSLDEVGGDRPFWLRSPVSGPRSRVEGALLAAAGRAGVPVTWVRDETTGNSDHREFELMGLPAAKLGVGAGGEPCRELACDRPSRLDPKSLVLARRLTAEALRSR